MSTKPRSEMSLGEKMQSVPKPILYLVLVLLTSLPLFKELNVPNKPNEASEDFYATVMAVPEGSTILIQSDWTGSTRGESGGEFESLMRILMRRKIKFAVYAAGDPQAPQVVKDSISRVNDERKLSGQPGYKQWDDWISLGNLPNAEAANQAIANNVQTAFPGRKAIPSTGGSPQDVFDSPVLKGHTKLSDFPLLVVVTASNTATIAIERYAGKVKMAQMVTGVMGPETLNYYPKQVVGLVVGLKGVYDIETLMEGGINTADPHTIKDDNGKFQGKSVEGFPGELNKGKATRYYPTLHFAFALLIIAVLIGNIGMFLAKKEAGK